MNKKDKKRTLNSRFLFTSLICAILFLISGLWVFLIPLLPVLLGLGIRLLLLSKRNVNTDQTKEAPSSPAPQPAPLDENDSFGHIQLRIAELVRHQFPKARWVWENPNARFDIENGAPLFIRLNRAGGFRRATVILNGDDVDDLSFCVTETPPTDTENDTPEEDEEELPPPPKENKELETLKAMGGISYDNVKTLMNLPDLDDMDYDPAGVYQALTGQEKADASSQDCMSVVLNRVTEKVTQLSRRAEPAQEKSGQTYTYVETDFIKALKNGYLVEIQEPTTIMQPGVLVGLNSLLEQTGSITLPTGEIIQRHPDTVIVVTTNVSYEGCRGLNQSVVDRMSLVRDVELPTPEVMVQRAMSVTGCTDEEMVGQMVQVTNDLSEYMRKNMISDGACGMRSLIDWINSTEITGDPYTSAIYTIISKASAEPENQEAFISTVLEPVFAPPKKKAS